MQKPRKCVYSMMTTGKSVIKFTFKPHTAGLTVICFLILLSASILAACDGAPVTAGDPYALRIQAERALSQAEAGIRATEDAQLIAAREAEAARRATDAALVVRQTEQASTWNDFVSTQAVQATIAHAAEETRAAAVHSVQTEAALYATSTAIYNAAVLADLRAAQDRQVQTITAWTPVFCWGSGGLFALIAALMLASLAYDWAQARIIAYHKYHAVFQTRQGVFIIDRNLDYVQVTPEDNSVYRRIAESRIMPAQDVTLSPRGVVAESPTYRAQSNRAIDQALWLLNWSREANGGESNQIAGHRACKLPPRLWTEIMRTLEHSGLAYTIPDVGSYVMPDYDDLDNLIAMIEQGEVALQPTPADPDVPLDVPPDTPPPPRSIPSLKFAP